MAATTPPRRPKLAARRRPSPLRAVLAGTAVVAAAVGLTACGGGSGTGETASSNVSAGPTAGEDEHLESDGAEVAAPAPRLVVTYDGGLQVIDALTLELVADLPLDGFNRINSAGDQRHVFVSTAGGFRLLDTGVYAVAHGDHAHYYAADPILEDGILFAAAKPGHVVAHDDLTTLFDDATGHVTVVESDEPEAVLREYDSPAAHHGVAVALPDGRLVVTSGTEEERTGIVVLDQDDAVLAESALCPNIHGEGVAAEEAVVFGCQGGALVYAGGQIVFAAAPVPEGRVSTVAGSEASSVLLGNYALTGSDGPSTAISLIDSVAGTLKTLDIGTAYNSFTLTEDGTGLVLGTDGRLHVIDLAAGQEIAAYPVLDPFEVPEAWQDPSPKLLVLEGMAYVTDPAAKTIHVVDPTTGEIWKSGSLEVTPNEIAGVNGEGAGEHEHDHEGEEGHEDD
jgi:outer membrane protein assembly factor BamB